MLLLCLYIQFSLSSTFLTFTYTQTLVDTYLLIHFCKYNQLMASYKNEKKNQIWRKTCYLWCLITKFSFPTYFFFDLFLYRKFSFWIVNKFMATLEDDKKKQKFRGRSYLRWINAEFTFPSTFLTYSYTKNQFTRN